MKSIHDLKIKIFADGADYDDMLELYADPLVKGFTTNPTLMRKAGVNDYSAFARKVLSAIPDRPVSFEVLADDFDEMERQAREISSWGANVYVKIPVTNTRGESSAFVIKRLSRAGVRVNVTAILTFEQVQQIADRLDSPCFISVFAGRIADTGRDPIPTMAAAVRLLESSPQAQLIWASPRELLNIYQAEEIGCHVITVTNDILKKLTLLGKNLNEYSLETVRMFYDDAQRAGFTLEVGTVV
ncbi:MAG TPA: transaldolase [Terriglobales bacterium]|nr:transaldolase [Terriglobales bacterium]